MRISLPFLINGITQITRDDLYQALLVLGAVCLFQVLICIAVLSAKPFSKQRRKVVGKGTAIFVLAATVVQLAVFILCVLLYSNHSVPAFSTEPVETSNVPPETTAIESQPDPTVPTTEVPETTVPVDPRTLFSPHATENTDAKNFGIEWEIIVDGEFVDSYERPESICFELDSEYFALPGIATFRGNNYRSEATYGTADITQEKLTILWKHPIGQFNKWGGCAWTGQPLVVQWDDETKTIMDTLYDSKKEKDDLVEVIYGTLDGYIHFYDLEDGTKTRDPIFMRMNFKGAGALDPRGYPILYIGGGINVGGYTARMYAISLIDGKILWEYGNADPDTHRRDWSAFDSSPLVDADTDTLIWPGENGILYTVKLNTVYDMESGTISLNPDTPVKTRYTSTYSRDERRFLGYEASAAIMDHYLFISENGGLFQCVDLNTMELVWTQDTKDDSNSSPLFSWEDGKGYIYTAPSLHWTAKGMEGVTSVYKLDAETGEVVWEYAFECRRADDIAGGVQASPLVGREGSDIEDLVIYTLARTPSAWKGKLVAFDKTTGEIVWETETGNYAWSSPVAFYTEEGKSYIFTGNASGICRLIDGATGEVLREIDLDQTIEASPVIFNNKMIIGTREGVFCFEIS